jgi:hypothetical protein
MRNLALLINPHEDRSLGKRYFHLDLKAVGVVERKDDDPLAGAPGGRGYYPNNDAGILSGFEITSQGDEDSVLRGGSSLYAHSLVFRGRYAIELEEALSTARVLKGLHRKLSKANDREGYHRSFGELVARVSDALGIKKFFLPAETSGDWNYASSTYRLVKVDEARNFLAEAEKQLAKGA